MKQARIIFIRPGYSRSWKMKKRDWLKEVGDSRWGILTDENGVKLYEGFMYGQTPQGSGTAYYPDGKKYQEGVFGPKGLLCGREYYPNGELRFEGLYRYNRNYGPNRPICGNFYSRKGRQIYSGMFAIRRGGTGYPTVVKPAGFGSVPQADRPSIRWRHYSEKDIEMAETIRTAPDEESG